MKVQAEEGEEEIPSLEVAEGLLPREGVVRRMKVAAEEEGELQTEGVEVEVEVLQTTEEEGHQKEVEVEAEVDSRMEVMVEHWKTRDLRIQMEKPGEIRLGVGVLQKVVEGEARLDMSTHLVKM
jgi:hypothetical protein